MISTTDFIIVLDLDDPEMAIDPPWCLGTSLGRCIEYMVSLEVESDHLESLPIDISVTVQVYI